MPRKSNVWRFFTKYSSDQARCNECDKSLKCVGGTTTGLAFHIKNVHGIDFSRDANIKEKRQKFCGNLSMEEEVSKMASVDGFTFESIACSDFVQESFKKRRDEYDVTPPTNPHTVRRMIISFYEKKKRELIDKFRDKCKHGDKFSLTLHECTNGNENFISIKVHSEYEQWALGIVPIKKLSNKDECMEYVNEKLKEFGLDISKHIVAYTSDDASIKSDGKILPGHQQCLAQGIHKAVLNVLYSENIIDEDNSDEDLNFNYEMHCSNMYSLALKDSYLNLIEKVRRVCKVFIKCPSYNEILQGFVKSEYGVELQLTIDVRTRWNSLLEMCERFYKLKSCLTQSLKICSFDEFSENEWAMVRSICHTLRRVEIVLSSLFSEDANLLKADKSIKLLLNKLALEDGPLARDMYRSLNLEYESRMQSDIVVLLRYLYHLDVRDESDPFANSVSFRDSLKEYATCIYSRLFHEVIPEIIPDLSSVKQEEEEDDEEDDFRKCFHKEMAKLECKTFCHSVRSDFNAEREFTLYEEQRMRSKNLERIYHALKTVKPASCEPEQAFSSAGFIATEIAYHISSDIISTLYFLKYFFKNNKKTKH